MDSRDIKILIIKPSSLGDVLHAFPAVTILKKHFPNAAIDWLVNPEFSKLIEFHKDVDTTIEFPRKQLGSILKCPAALAKLSKKLREKRYDMVIDFQGLLRSALVAKLTNSAATYGFDKPKESIARMFYTHKIAIDDNACHAIEKNVSLVNKILSTHYTIPEDSVQQIKSYSDSLAVKLAEAEIEPEDYCIGIVAGARWESKKWPPEFFAEAINKANEKNPKVKFVIIGAPSDEGAAEEIIKLVPNTKTISFAGKTSIGELVELIRRCNVVLTNDSGPMHISAALNVKTVALFGPTDPDKTGPFGKDSTVVTAKNLDCLRCMKRVCPTGSNSCHLGVCTDEVSTLITENA